MKRLLVLICLIILGFQLSQAQNLNFTWSPVFEIKYKDEVNHKVLFANDDELVLLRKSQGRLPLNPYYEVVNYGADLKEIYKLEISPKYGTTNDAQWLVDVVKAQDKIIVVYEHFIKADGKSYYEYAEISEDGKLSEIKRLGNVEHSKYSEKPEVQVAVSPDETKFGIFARKDHQRKTNEKWMVWGYDVKDQKKIFEKSIETEVQSKKSVYNEAFINNSGNIQVYKRWKVKKEGYKYAIYTIPTTGQMVQTMIDIEENEIADKKIFFNKEGNLTVCGLYHKAGKSWSPFTGTFVSTYNHEGNNIINNFEYFGEMVLGLVYPNSKRAKKEDIHIKNYKLTSVSELDNSTISIVIENLKEFKLSAKDPNKPFLTNFDRTHGKAIVIRLTKEGKKIWAQSLDKEQKYTTQRPNKFWGGVVPVFNNGNEYLIFNQTTIPKKFFKSGLFVGTSGYFATFIAGIDKEGQPVYTEEGHNNSVPIYDLYKDRKINPTFNSKFYGSGENSVYLFMEMIQGAEKGGTKWQICKITFN